MRLKKRQLDATDDLVVRSGEIRKIEHIIKKVATKDVPIALIGESGTGKDMLARRVHQLSHRKNGPFIPINCAAIPESLFESELFGHERGAFTGATARARGKVEAANQGTLFLDEVGEMPLPMQAKLLRFIENRRYMRVGGSIKLDADVRLVFATLRPLEEEVKAGRFRADLYYRIQGVTISVPPLRERRADILPLIETFVAHFSSKHGVRAPRFSREAKATLVQYGWPGNVRELRNVVELMCLLREGRSVKPYDLPEPLHAAVEAGAQRPSDAHATTICVNVDLGLDAIIDRVVQHTLALEGGNKLRSAFRLGVSLRTVQRYVAAGRAQSSNRP